VFCCGLGGFLNYSDGLRVVEVSTLVAKGFCDRQGNRSAEVPDHTLTPCFQSLSDRISPHPSAVIAYPRGLDAWLRSRWSNPLAGDKIQTDAASVNGKILRQEIANGVQRVRALK
jgi:hypothetical protein